MHLRTPESHSTRRTRSFRFLSHWEFEVSCRSSASRNSRCAFCPCENQSCLAGMPDHGGRQIGLKDKHIVVLTAAENAELTP